jgi:SAM-dependent methyltransferase
MAFKELVRDLLMHPLARGIDLESAEATDVHARLIREKPFLRGLYEQYYEEFTQAHESSPEGARLEIGAGGGFLDELIPELLTLDLRPGARVSIVGSALELPLADGSAGAIFMLNVLHHLPDPARFFEEASRVLAPGGRLVMIEPFVSPWSKLVFKHLHHEPFEPDRGGWETAVDGPLAGANGAVPWMIFVRDLTLFEAQFPALEVLRVEPHTVLRYLLSGGVSMRDFLPAAALGPLSLAECVLPDPIKQRASMLMTVELVRRPPQPPNPRGGKKKGGRR